MSNESQAKVVTRALDVEGLIKAIQEAVNLLDCLVIVNAADPEVSGVLSADDETYREVVPLGDGVHIVLSVGDLATKLDTGIHEIEV